MERWLPVLDYEGLYEVSDQGRVRSLDRTVYSESLDRHSKLKGRNLKMYVGNNGYLYVNLNDATNGLKPKQATVHRLVAHAFIANLCNYPCVNHINGIRDDARASNLEWCDYSYNNLDTYSTGRKSPKTKPIIAISPTGERLTFKSAYHASLRLGMSDCCVRNVLKGRTQTSQKWRFEYAG